MSLHGHIRKPEEAEINLCSPHIVELLQAYSYSHVVCLGEETEKHYNLIRKSIPHLPGCLRLPDTDSLNKLDYLLLPIIKAGQLLRWKLTQTANTKHAAVF